MNVFAYKARTQQNDTVNGRVEASSAKEAGAILRERGLFVISVSPYNESIFAGLINFSRISYNDIVNFTRQLATMSTAGLPLVESLGILEAQAKPKLQSMINTVRRDVEGGLTLAKALEKHPSVFTRVYVSLIKAGESAGVLDKVLSRLADTLEKQKEFRAKTKGALIYPVIIILAMGVAAVVMMVFVVPKLTEMYADFGAELPGPTKALIALSDFMVAFWYVFLALGIGGAIGFRAYARTESGRLKIDELLLKLPIAGTLISKIALVELTRTMALLLAAGISLLQALEISLDAVGNLVYRNALVKVMKDIEKGQTLSSAIGRRPEFPILMSQMISVGEETGQMDQILLKLSAYFESESEHAVKGLTTAMEPLIMILLGIGVGFMIIAIIMPIYNLTSTF